MLETSLHPSSCISEFINAYLLIAVESDHIELLQAILQVLHEQVYWNPFETRVQHPPV